MSERKKILFFGSEGRIGKSVCSALSKDYDIVGVDVMEAKSDFYSDYMVLNGIDQVPSLYEGNDYYAVVHCQQFKPAGFVDHSLKTVDLDFIDKVLDVNVKLPIVSTSNYIHRVAGKPDPGRIINLGSTYGLISSNPVLYENTEMGNPFIYTVSKFGIGGLTKYVGSYFKEYNILCNSISPHGIENNQDPTFVENFSHRSPMGRLSQPDELVSAFEFLLDERNTYVNGANIPVDGGWTAC